jgi:hypothetical protein
VSVRLKQFNNNEIRINQSHAHRILRFFFPDISLTPKELTQEDISFAQSLLVEAIDTSYDSGLVEHLFSAFQMKIPVNFEAVKDVISDFTKTSSIHWFRFATPKDLENPLIYENVRLMLAQNFRSIWKVREQIGEIIY